MKAYTIFIDGISKAFAATGVRVGWTMAPEEIIIKMRSLNSHVGSWAPMAEQKAVAKFLVNQPALDKYFSHFKKEISERLYTIHAAFQKMKEEGMPVDSIEPQGGIYLTVKIDLKGKKLISGKEILNQESVTDYILNEAELALDELAAQSIDHGGVFVLCDRAAQLPECREHHGGVVRRQMLERHVKK